jgi:hypothetical protein
VHRHTNHHILGRISGQPGLAEIRTVAHPGSVATAGATDQAHVFLSYSRSDLGYTQRLVDHLKQARISVFWDQDVPEGARWSTILRDRIDRCRAFIVVMTPLAEESRGVEREINRAERAGCLIVPLLLSGKPFFLLSDRQFHDVRDATMPSDRLVERLRTVAGRARRP